MQDALTLTHLKLLIDATPWIIAAGLGVVAMFICATMWWREKGYRDWK